MRMAPMMWMVASLTMACTVSVPPSSQFERLSGSAPGPGTVSLADIDMAQSEPDTAPTDAPSEVEAPSKKKAIVCMEQCGDAFAMCTADAYCSTMLTCIDNCANDEVNCIEGCIYATPSKKAALAMVGCSESAGCFGPAPVCGDGVCSAVERLLEVCASDCVSASDCCWASQATCGFVAACGTSCGACSAGQACGKNECTGSGDSCIEQACGLQILANCKASAGCVGLLAYYNLVICQKAAKCQDKACVDKACPAELQACNANPNCTKLYDCAYQCVSSSCVSTCWKSIAGDEAVAIMQCASTCP